MRPSLPFIALSIGTFLAFSPIQTASAQTASSDRSSSRSTTAVRSSASDTAAPLHETDQPTQVQISAAIETEVARQKEITTLERRSSAAEDSAAIEEATEIEESLEAATSPDAETVSQAAQDSTAESSVAQIAPNVDLPPSGTTPGSNETPTPTEDSADESTSPSLIPTPSTTTPLNGTPSAPVRSASETSVPDYLDANPNPLLFPTRPEEVEVEGIQPITLEQALEVARRNNRDLQVAVLQLERNRAILREAQAANSPTVQVNGSLTAQENQQRNVSPLLGGNPDDINTTLGGTVQLNYNVFTSGQRSASIRAAEGQVRFQELQVEIQAEQLRLEVTNDYYDLQEADERVRISTAALEQAQRSLADAEAQERAGIGTRFDVLQAQVDVANAQQQLIQDLSEQRTSRRELARRLSLPEQVGISAADPVSAAAQWNLTLEDSIVLAYRNRAELEQQLVQREISRQQRRAALAENLPQLGVFAQYSVQNTLNQDTGFDDTYQFGAQLNWNVFDGGAARARARQQEINIEISEAQFGDARNQVRLDVESAFISLQANASNIQTATLALEQAAEALRLARLRFQAGVGTQTDVLRSQTELTRAEVNQLNAILGYNRSLVALQRAVSNIPAGNLAEAP